MVNLRHVIYTALRVVIDGLRVHLLGRKILWNLLDQSLSQKVNLTTIFKDIIME